MQALREADAADVQVVVGGIVPGADEGRLLDSGVARVFHPGSSLQEIAEAVRVLANKARAARQEARS